MNSINPGDINVLIAEDEADLRDLLAAKFRVFGFNVMTAHSGNSAWDKILQNSNIQIVITDDRMPNGSGFELLSKIKQQNSEFPRVFVISAFCDHTPEQLYHQGAEGFINKPFDTKVLLDVVRKSLLDTGDRWAHPLSRPPDITITENMGSKKDAIARHAFEFGRGGFFVETDKKLPSVGSLIGFDILMEPWHLAGAGHLRWILPRDNSSTTMVVGIEIVSLSGPSAAEVVCWISDAGPRPYIPLPMRLQTSTSKPS